MKNDVDDIKVESREQKGAGASVVLRVVKYVAFSLLGLIVLVVIGVVTLTAWLTPARTARLVSEYGSRYIDGGIKVDSVYWTLWSTWPRFETRMVGLELNGADCGEKDNGPKLLNVSSLRGGVDVWSLIKHDLFLDSIVADGLRVNVIESKDGLANYNILSDAELKELSKFKVDSVSLPGIRFEGKTFLGYQGRGADVGLDLSRLDLDVFLRMGGLSIGDVVSDRIERSETTRRRGGRRLRSQSETTRRRGGRRLRSQSETTRQRGGRRLPSLLSADIEGIAFLSIDGQKILTRLPVGLSGAVELGDQFGTVDVNGLNVRMGEARGQFDGELEYLPQMEVKSLDFDIPMFCVSALLARLPAGLVPMPAGLEGKFYVGTNGKLLKPFRIGKDTIPELSMGLEAMAKSVSYKMKNTADIRLDSLRFRAGTSEKVKVAVYGGEVQTPHWGCSIRLDSLSLSTVNIDSLQYWVKNGFKGMKIPVDLALAGESSGCRLSLKGEIEGIGRFLDNGNKDDLAGNLKLDIGTLDINRVCRDYELGAAFRSGQPLAEVLKPTARPALDGADSVPGVIPGWVDFTVDCRARSLVYHVGNSLKTDGVEAVGSGSSQSDNTEAVGLTFAGNDVSTVLSCSDGVARIGDLTLHTPYGAVSVDVKYNGKDKDDLAMSTTVRLNDISFERFVESYGESLLAGQPMAEDLRGDVSGEIRANIRLYPSNFFDLASLTAVMDLHCDSIAVRQTDEVRKYTRWAFIHKGDVIPIDDFDVKMVVHDRLVELYPFRFKVDRYTVEPEGVFNFKGDMYWHVGVLHSILPFGFGVNVKGSFEHPEFRFGGRELKPRSAEAVTSLPEGGTRDVNLMQYLGWGFAEFVKTAARL